MNHEYIECKQLVMSAESPIKFGEAKKRNTSIVRGWKLFFSGITKDVVSLGKRAAAFKEKSKFASQIIQQPGECGVPQKAGPGRKKAKTDPYLFVGMASKGKTKPFDERAAAAGPESPIDMSSPMVVCGLTELGRTFEADAGIWNQLSHLQNVLSTRQTATCRRSQIPMSLEQQADTHSKLMNFAGEGKTQWQGVVHVPHQIDEKVKVQFLSTASWGMAYDSKYVGTEKGEVGVIKLCLFGERCVGACSVVEMVEAMRKAKEEADLLPTSEELYAWMKLLTVEQMESFDSMRWSVLQKYDLIYIPQGFITIEHPSTKDVCMGVKANIIGRQANVDGLQLLADMYQKDKKLFGEQCVVCARELAMAEPASMDLD